MSMKPFITEGGLEIPSGKNLELAGTTLSEIKDAQSAQSSEALLTENAIVDYVAQQITAEDLDFAGDSGTGSVDLDSQSITIAGGSNLTSSASNQTLTIALDDSITVTSVSDGTACLLYTSPSPRDRG